MRTGASALKSADQPSPDWLARQPDGEMAGLVRDYDWSRTAAGPIADWPECLKTSVSLCLASRFQIIIFWTRRLIQIYNDAFIRIAGDKHPLALGQTARESWPEMWAQIEPLYEQVFTTGQATWAEHIHLPVRRYGLLEESFYTMSYTPIFLPDGSVGGVFNVILETTLQVVAERRTLTLRDLGARTAQAHGVEEACRIAMEVLRQSADIPFALIYLLQPEGDALVLAEAAGVVPGDSCAPAALRAGDRHPWPVFEAVQSGQVEIVRNLRDKLGDLPGGPWGDPTEIAVVHPLIRPSTQQPYGVLITGVTPQRPFDDDFRAFLGLVAGLVATAIGNVRAYEEERARALALAELDRAKTTFFSNVSHEFRTPLTLLLAPLEDLLASGPILDDSRELLSVMRRNARRLLKLVNTLLDFSRIEAGRLAPLYAATDLARYTADLASVFRSAVEKAGLRLLVDCPADLDPVYVDRGMWEKIVLNLLSNAFKHTFSGDIAVSLRPRGKQVVLTVRDTGVGIPPAELPRLFDRFHRVEGAPSRTQEGSGIGLALVKELVALHGGRVGVASELGSGTTLTVSIPRGRDHLPPDRVQEAAGTSFEASNGEMYLEEALHWIDSTEAEPAPLAVAHDAPATAEERQPGRRPTVLLADDNADMREYMARLLSAEYEVAAVANGRRALELALADQPDLVLTDVMMPQLDGFALLRAMREEPRTSSIPVIMLSARAGEEARIEGLEAGADDYLIKPFSARELLARVGSTLQLARVRRQAAEREALLQAEHLQVLDNIGDGFVALDSAFRYKFLNAAWERMVQRPRKSALGRTAWEVFPEFVGTAEERWLRERMVSRVPGDFEVFWEPQGRWFQTECYPAPDGGLVIYFRDITDRKRTEAVLREANEGLERKVAERTAELEQRASELARSNAELERFSYVASHDLREPLRMVANFTQLLAHRYRGRLGPDADDFIAFAVEGVERMEALIKGLIAFSRVRIGPQRLAWVSLNEVFEEARTNLGDAIQSSGAVIERGNLPMLRAEPVLMVQLFQNLLSNAIKFRREGETPCVRITAEVFRDGPQPAESGRSVYPDSRRIEIRMVDNGIGIAPEHRERIFGMFRRLHTREEFEGTGIGLAICQRIVEQHGGQIRVEENPEGPGSCFVVTLNGGG